MYRSLQVPYLLIAICLLCSILLVGCQNQTVTSSSASSIGIQTVVLRDPTPDQLSASFFLSVGGYSSADRDTTTIALSLTNEGRFVHFAGNEHLICNGKNIPLHQLPLPPVIHALTRVLEGKIITCTYSAKGTSATTSFTVPHTAFISTPRNQMLLPRSARTFITYSKGESAIEGIVALGTNTKAIAQLDTPHLNQAVIDTSTLNAGTGTITLTQDLKVVVKQTGKNFMMVQASGNTVAMVTVTWT